MSGGGRGRDADKKAAEAAITNPLMSKLNEGGGGGGGEKEGRDRNGKFSLSGNATAEKKWVAAKGEGGREREAAGREGGRLSSAN